MAITVDPEASFDRVRDTCGFAATAVSFLPIMWIIKSLTCYNKRLFEYFLWLHDFHGNKIFLVYLVSFLFLSAIFRDLVALMLWKLSLTSTFRELRLSSSPSFEYRGPRNPPFVKYFIYYPFVLISSFGGLVYASLVACRLPISQ